MWCSRGDLSGAVDVEGALLGEVAISILILSDPLMLGLLAVLAIHMDGVGGGAASGSHLAVHFPLGCTSVFVDLHDRILYPSAIFTIGSFICRSWRILLSRDLATLMHHFEHLLIVGRIVH